MPKWPALKWMFFLSMVALLGLTLTIAVKGAMLSGKL